MHACGGALTDDLLAMQTCQQTKSCPERGSGSTDWTAGPMIVPVGLRRLSGRPSLIVCGEEPAPFHYVPFVGVEATSLQRINRHMDVMTSSQAQL
jgi:hypothetical protein